MSLHEKPVRGLIDGTGLASPESLCVREYTRSRKSMDKVVNAVKGKDDE
jgi:hypothetical protein